MVCCSRYVSALIGPNGARSGTKQFTNVDLCQCIAANFVKGSVPTPSACKNSSGVTGAFKDDPTLSALVGPSSVNSTTPSKTDASASGVSKTAAPSHSKSADAASALQAWSTTGFSMGGAITLVSMVLAGGALMI